MNVRRTRYYCPVELAVDVLGSKWAVVVLAHLKDGEHRYGELRRRMPDVSEKVLTTRLRELQAAGLVDRASDGGTPPAVTYRLTPGAAELTPALNILYDWGQRQAVQHGIPIEPAP